MKTGVWLIFTIHFDYIHYLKTSFQISLDVPECNIVALQEADLSKGLGLKECTHAAFSVLHALQADLSPGSKS